MSLSILLAWLKKNKTKRLIDKLIYSSRFNENNPALTEQKYCRLWNTDFDIFEGLCSDFDWVEVWERFLLIQLEDASTKGRGEYPQSKLLCHYIGVTLGNPQSHSVHSFTCWEMLKIQRLHTIHNWVKMVKFCILSFASRETWLHRYVLYNF